MRRGLAGGRPVPLLRHRRRDAVVPGRAGGVGGERAGRGARRRPRAGWRTRWTPAAGSCGTSPGASPGGLVQQGWRDTIDAAGDADGGGYVRADGTNPRAAAGRRRHAGGRVRGAARGALADRRPGAGRGAPSALRALLSERFGPEVMALEAGDVVGARGRLAARLAAVGGRARARGGAARPRDRLCEPDILTRVRAAHAGGDRPELRPVELPPRRGLAVRLVAGLGRAARARARARGRAGADRRAGRARRARAARRSSTRSTTPLAPIPLSNRVQAWTIGARWALEHAWDGRV